MSIGSKNNKKQKRSPEQMRKFLIEVKGNEAEYFVESKLGECRNETEELYWKNVLYFIRKGDF